MPRADHSDMYTASHRAIKGARGSSSSRPRPALAVAEPQRKNETIIQPNSVPPQQGAGDTKPNLAETLFGEDADAKLLLRKDDSRRNSTSAGPMPALAEDLETLNLSPKSLVASLRRCIAEDETKDKKLIENKKRGAELRAELRELEDEAFILTIALRRSKAERRRLRSSVSERELEFLEAGQDLVQGGAKRIRFTEDSGSEGGEI